MQKKTPDKCDQFEVELKLSFQHSTLFLKRANLPKNVEFEMIPAKPATDAQLNTSSTTDD